uniref:Transmembrane protein 132E n=1 Tax=Strigamia maritima TaxID=126957 RepID=T1J6G2_STRMM
MEFPQSNVKMGPWFWCVCLLLISTDISSGVEVSFESWDAGYFLKPLQGESLPEDAEFNHHLDRFTVLHATQINMVRSSYGPFTAKQTVPAMTLLHMNDSNGFQGTTLLDVSAHIVTKEVRRDQPLLRVLFHLGVGGRDAKVMKLGAHTVCITLVAEREGERLTTTCMPTPRDGTCLAEVTIPAHWWPPLDQVQGVKLRNLVHLEYALSEGECSSLFPSIPTQPTTRLEDVPLSTAHGQYLELKQDEVVRILIPQGLVYPRSRVYVPVYMYPNPAYPIYVFVLRARVRNGVKILGAQASQPDKWTITLDTNPKQTVATVTAFVKDANTASPETLPQSSQEVFSWLFEIEENVSSYDSARIIWNLRYVLDSSMAEQYNFDDNNIKMTSQLEVKKDDIQAVLPTAKTWELMNTALLNGKQVSHPMKVYIVSQAGKVADVTLRSTCQSVDESILKVSSSCTSVYLDGSEIRGSHNASIIVTYEGYKGQAQFTVWVPELPLDIQLADTKLSQIKGWKVPNSPRNKLKRVTVAVNGGGRNSKITTLKGNNAVTPDDANEDGKSNCRLRFQQTSVDVYARFFAVDDNSGRESYLINRKAYFRITNLVEGSLRVADPRIASLKGQIVQGQSVGRTEIQVLSPISHRMIGAHEVHVGNDKITLDFLKVTVVTGLQLSIQRDDDFPNTYEGLLDIRLSFSDGSVVPLSQISETDYHLTADTLDNTVVAFAPKMAQHHPRIIAIGQGKGDLLQVTLELSETCQRRRSPPLATNYVYVDVDFFDLRGREGLQNDEHGIFGSDLYVKLNGGVRNEKNERLFVAEDGTRGKGKGKGKGNKNAKPNSKPSVEAHQDPVHLTLGLKPLEIGLFALLGIFCIAIITFMVSCGVYAVRYRRKQLPPGAGESVTNAHDWVWLGRANLETGAAMTSSTGSHRSAPAGPPSDLNGNQRKSRHNSQSSTRNSVHSNNVGTASRPTSNRSSNISYPGSDVGMRITTNPQADDGAKQNASPVAVNTATATDDAQPLSDVYVSSDGNPTTPPPLPERRVRIQSNPIPMSARDDELKPMDGSATFTIQKPPVPPHANKCEEPAPVVRNRGVRVLPSELAATWRSDKSVGATLSDAEWEAATMGMDYDQLMDYFENLKESNA